MSSFLLVDELQWKDFLHRLKLLRHDNARSWEMSVSQGEPGDVPARAGRFRLAPDNSKQPVGLRRVNQRGSRDARAHRAPALIGRDAGQLLTNGKIFPQGDRGKERIGLVPAGAALFGHLPIGRIPAESMCDLIGHLHDVTPIAAVELDADAVH